MPSDPAYAAVTSCHARYWFGTRPYQPTRCPVLTQRMVLSAYVMSGTGFAYSDISLFAASVWCYQGGAHQAVGSVPPIVLRMCYAMSGTDLAYLLCGVWYCPSVFCHTASGTDLAYVLCVVRRPLSARERPLSGALRYPPTRVLCVVRYRCSIAYAGVRLRAAQCHALAWRILLSVSARAMCWPAWDRDGICC
eukprot:573654-Rhodomonas_salina.6